MRASRSSDGEFVKDPRSSRCQVLSPGIGADHITLPADFEHQDAQGRARKEPVRSLMAIILGSDRVTRPVPRESSRLERPISMLRSSGYDGMPWTRCNRAMDALRLLGDRASELLMELLAREAADAARWLSNPTRASAVSREETRRLHLLASAYFETARMPSYSRPTDKRTSPGHTDHIGDWAMGIAQRVRQRTTHRDSIIDGAVILLGCVVCATAPMITIYLDALFPSRARSKRSRVIHATMSTRTA
ncbi:hypothetical protein ACVILL_000867 [Bradyrhizobium sp. USDA 3364]